jgi:putative hydrolase of the HAD superfamily
MLTISSTMKATLPKALLLDLDDTILDDSGRIAECWRHSCRAHSAQLPDIDLELFYATIDRESRSFWADPDRHRVGRLDLLAARSEVVARALAKLGIENREIAGAIADAFGMARDRAIEPCVDAIDTLRWLRSIGCRLALLTNGAARPQQAKIERFGLAEFFEHILIEGELGFGKPDPRVYLTALDHLALAPADVWMIGDNLEWDVAAPQRLGIFGIWVDYAGTGLPAGHRVCPDRIIRSLSEVRQWAAPAESFASPQL